MKARWFLFAHGVVKRGADEPRPMFAVHLVADDEWERLSGGTVSPSSGDSIAKFVTASEPAGFVLACSRCLALSEVHSG